MKNKLVTIFNQFISQEQIKIKLCFDMPVGYELAYGTFDITKETLFLNLDMLKKQDETEAMFYLFHELRHAVQFMKPEKFASQIRESLPYVILYDGKCFKLFQNKWSSCKLNGYDFLNYYLSLPYELDANKYAFEIVKSKIPNNELHKLTKVYEKTLPKKLIDFQTLKELFKEIDKALS